jgi:signal peptidase I
VIDESASLPLTGHAGSKPVRWWSRELLKIGLLALVMLLGVRTFLQPYAVEGSSMSPGLEDGERLFISRAVYLHLDTTRLLNLLPGVERSGSNVVFPFHAPERGDVVVFDAPTPADEPYIKRVVGLPGETVSIHDGAVFVDGVPLAEPYIEGLGPLPTDCTGQWCDVTVPANSIYVLGDNRLPLQSVDSRTFGPISYDRIIGQAIFSTWPLDTLGPIPGT